MVCNGGQNGHYIVLSSLRKLKGLKEEMGQFLGGINHGRQGGSWRHHCNRIERNLFECLIYDGVSWDMTERISRESVYKM